MSRPNRCFIEGESYHVLNRGNGPSRIFLKDADYLAFLRILAEAGKWTQPAFWKSVHLVTNLRSTSRGAILFVAKSNVQIKTTGFGNSRPENPLCF